MALPAPRKGRRGCRHRTNFQHQLICLARATDEHIGDYRIVVGSTSCCAGAWRSGDEIGRTYLFVPCPRTSAAYRSIARLSAIAPAAMAGALTASTFCAVGIFQKPRTRGEKEKRLER